MYCFEEDAELLEKEPEEIVEYIKKHTEKNQRNDIFIAAIVNFNLNEEYEKSRQIAQLLQKEYPDGRFEDINSIFTNEIRTKIKESTEGRQQQFLEALGKEYEKRMESVKKEVKRRALIEKENKGKFFDPTVGAMVKITKKELLPKNIDLPGLIEGTVKTMNTNEEYGTMVEEIRPESGLPKVVKIISGVGYEHKTGKYDYAEKRSWGDNEGKIFDEKGKSSSVAKQKLQMDTMKKEDPKNVTKEESKVPEESFEEDEF